MMWKRHKLLCALLIAALLAQCTAAAFAASPLPEVYHLVGGEPDAQGVWTPEYWADSDGNRFEESAAPRMRAAVSLPSSYDLRDYGLVTPVKHQAGSDSCWAFSAIASLESSYIRQGYGTLADTDFSEAHLTWFAQRQRTTDTTDPTYGDGLVWQQPFLKGGNWNRTSSTLLRGSGLQLEENAPWIATYDADVMMQMEQPESDRYVSYARMWSAVNCNGSTTALKQKIMQNGAATLAYYDDYMTTRTGYNSDKSSYYQTAKVGETNHMVAVIGWDDDYPRELFNAEQRPENNGAWLVKGSWSAAWGKDGYYWISYEDPSLSQFASFIAAPEEVYDHIYQYDGSFPRITFSMSNSGKMANVFTASRTELLTHVAFYSATTSPIQVTAEVYVAPEDFVYSGMHPTSGMQKVSEATTTVSGVEYGYSTVELKSPTLLKAGQVFTVVLTMARSGGTVMIPAEGQTVQNPGDGILTYSGKTGQSFLGYNGNWYDTNAYPSGSGTVDYNNMPLKAMTRDVTPQAQSLTIIKAPNKTKFYVDETLDTTGLSLLCTDAQGNASVVTSGFTCDPLTFSAPGKKTVTVTYNGMSVSYEVEAVLTDPTLSLVTPPDKTAYKVGQTLDTTGLALLYTDAYGVEQTVTDGFICTPQTLRTLGTKTVTVTYEGLSVTFDVTIEPYVRKLALRSTPTTTTYLIGDTLDTTGMRLAYTDEFGKTTNVTDGFVYTPETFTEFGMQAVTVTYNELSVMFNVNVVPYETTLTLFSDPNKTTYKVGESFDPTGLSLIYSDEYGNANEVYEGYTYAPQTLTVIGTQIVTVTYEGLTADIDVTVEPYTPTLSLTTPPDKTTYTSGEALDPTGLELLYTDEYGDALVVTEGFTFEPATLTGSGTQTVTVTYNDLSVTFDVTVEQAGLFLVTDAAARAGETFEVAVRIADNPGVVAAWLEIAYDPDVLTLEGVENGGIFPDSCFTPCNDLSMLPFRTLFLDALSENYTQDGDLVVLTFRVRADAPAGTSTISVTYDADSTYDVDLQNVPFAVQDGTVTVNRLPGDVNADGVINLKDVVLLRRYLADWGVTINTANADVDQLDGVTLRDVTLISRYIAGGYDVVLV